MKACTADIRHIVLGPPLTLEHFMMFIPILTTSNSEAFYMYIFYFTSRKILMRNVLDKWSSMGGDLILSDVQRIAQLELSQRNQLFISFALGCPTSQYQK